MTKATYTTAIPGSTNVPTIGQTLLAKGIGVASTWGVQPVPNNQITNGSGQAIMTVPAGTNTLEVTGNMMINGVDLEERLKIIEKVLMIPERDVTMEAKYPSLKKKFDEYINSLAKYRTFEAIKGDTK